MVGKVGLGGRLPNESHLNDAARASDAIIDAQTSNTADSSRNFTLSLCVYAVDPLLSSSPSTMALHARQIKADAETPKR
jgi:hypothetical protein